MTREEYLKAADEPNVLRFSDIKGAFHFLSRDAAMHQLLPAINAILGNGPLPQPPLSAGDAIDERYAVSLAPETAREICAALQEAERKYGFSATFGKRQINSITASWRRYCDSLPAR